MRGGGVCDDPAPGTAFHSPQSARAAARGITRSGGARRLLSLALLPALAVLSASAPADDPAGHRPSVGRVRLVDGLLTEPLPRVLPLPGTEPAEPVEHAEPVQRPGAEAFPPDGSSGIDDEPLPPLEDELRLHGGSHLYEPEGEQFDAFWNGRRDLGDGSHFRLLRVPEGWQRPDPVTAYQQFEGNDPIHAWPGLQWFGEEGFQWEPRFVGYGSYEVFGLALEQGGTRQDAIGQQLIVDLDLRVTGTERIHVQFRPLGERNTGGSLWRLDDPRGYEDNSTGIPDRWWIEGELYSLLGGVIDDPFTPLDYHLTAGKVPYTLHNALLVNDEMTGFILTKNTLIIPPLSNLLIQGFYFLDDVDTRTPRSSDMAGVHAQADWRHVFVEATFAWVSHGGAGSYDTRYGAISATKFFGPLSLAGRAMFKDGDAGGTGDGALFVLESNLFRAMPHAVSCTTGIESAVCYANAFRATTGWSPIAGANFNRLRSNFAVNPLVRIGQGFDPADTTGVTLGTQLFRHEEDESFTPEVSWEELRGESVWAVGLRWQRKLSPRVYLDVNGVRAWSDDRALEREGVFGSLFVIF